MWNCVICGSPLNAGTVSTVGKKGLESLKSASEKRHDGLVNAFNGCDSIQVHLDCRIDYTRPNSIAKAARNNTLTSEDLEEERPKLRSSLGAFDISTDCLFCGKEASVRKETKKEAKYRRVVHEVTTIPFRQIIQHHADKRADDWGITVRARVDSVVDLIAAEAKYHRQCHLIFVSGSYMDIDGPGSGRCEDKQKLQAFRLLCEYMEGSEDCQFSLADIEECMRIKCEELCCEPYTRKYVKEKLMSHYGQRISVTELPGKNTVLNFKGTADKILYDTWYAERKTSDADERRRIVEKAAQIVREDIRAQPYELSLYPSVEESSLNVDVLPDTLTHFLKTIVTTKADDSRSISTKHKALGQAIVAACRPKSFLSPILLGFGVYLHRHYGSMQLVDLLSSLGFSLSYNEILRYENCVIAHETGKTTLGDGECVQFSFDKADFNVRTMTGHDTFHSMGGVMMSTPAPKVLERTVPRSLHLTATAATTGHGHMDITWYQKPAQHGLRRVVVKELTVTSTEISGVVERARAVDDVHKVGQTQTSN